jgi:hypothetical protein
MKMVLLMIVNMIVRAPFKKSRIEKKYVFSIPESHCSLDTKSKC